MTYWIVIAMIFIAILTVSLAAARADDADDRSVAGDEAPNKEGTPADDDV